MRASDDVRTFFKSIKDSDDLLLFLRLYYDPESVLGSSHDMDEAEKEYYDLFDYFRLMMNNHLTEFVTAVRRDRAFAIKIDNNPQILRKLNFFVFDSIDFKKYYHLYDDKNLVALTKNKISVKEYLHMEGSLSGSALFEFCSIFEKYKRLYEYGYPSDLVDSYDAISAQNIAWKLNGDADAIIEKQMKKQELDELKQNVFSQIEQEDCTESADFLTFLCRNPILEPDDYELNYYLYTNFGKILLCQNKFLRVIEEKMNNSELGGFPLDNAIDIITMSIDIKTRNHPEAVWYRREVIDPSLVDEFDLEYAKDLCTRLIIYRRMRSRQIRKDYLRVIK